MQEKNLHALWDGLLGKRFDSTSTNRRAAEIVNDKELAKRGQSAIDSPEDLKIQTWLDESREAAKLTCTRLKLYEQYQRFEDWCGEP